MGARAWTAALLGLALAGGALTAPTTSSAVPARADDPVRLAVVGDSLAHGSSGDWTWRYFLHHHLVAGSTSVDFVGSRSDVWDHEGDDYDDSTTPRGSAAYVDPDFDRDHESLWSRALTYSPQVVPELMAAHRPDVVVLALGFNDLAWWGATPSSLVERVRQQVETMREANPSVDVVVSQVMADADYWARHPPHPPVAGYNDLLLRTAPGWSTAESRVAVAQVPAGYRADGPEQLRDTWDGVHPDTSGQVKIAAEVARALAVVGLGVGPDPAFVPPVEGLRSSSTLSVAQPAGRPTAVRLTWRGPPGATGHDVWMAEGSQAWRAVAWGVASGRVITDLVPGRTYSFKVVARKYAVRSADDQFSAPVRLTVPTRTLSGVRVRPGDRRLRVSWAPTRKAVGYRVQWRRSDVPDRWRTRALTGTAVTLSPLVAGAPHRVRVTAVVPDAPREVVTRSARVRGPRLRRVTGLVATERAGRGDLAWRAVPESTHYRVERRSGGAWTPVRATVRGTRVRLRLPAGAHRIRVRAMHQLWAGPASRTVSLRLR